jgi:glycosyltransferase involved in cell wall biosynthesis
MRAVDPRSTVAYFWPAPPPALVRECRQLGIASVREMINSPCELSRRILDEAYRHRGLPPAHPVTQEAADAETAELRDYDHVFSSNPEVTKALLGLGVPAESILETSFGWRPERFEMAGSQAHRQDGFRAVFVGMLCVRKGILDLLEAWSAADIGGELVLAGSMEEGIEGRIRPYLSERIKWVGFMDDLAGLYGSADVFIFPTYEEGGPQVTYEAAGCGLPIITTPMGSARLVRDGETGIIVPPGDVEALTQAIRSIAGSALLRSRMGAAARDAAAQFTFERVGKSRGQILLNLIESHASAAGGSPRP